MQQNQWRTNHLAGPRLQSFHGALLTFFVYAPLETIVILNPHRCYTRLDSTQPPAKWNVIAHQG